MGMKGVIEINHFFFHYELFNLENSNCPLFYASIELWVQYSLTESNSNIGNKDINIMWPGVPTGPESYF